MTCQDDTFLFITGFCCLMCNDSQIFLCGWSKVFCKISTDNGISLRRYWWSRWDSRNDHQRVSQGFCVWRSGRVQIFKHIYVCLTRALLGLWIFHRLLGGGAFERPPPMISAPGRRREKQKAAFESSQKIISKSFRSFFGSGQNWGLQGSKFQNFPKRFFYNKIFNLNNRATNLIPSCLSR